MEYKILFTEDALADLKTILDYIRRDNPAAADRFGQALLNHIELLRTFPRIGVPVPARLNIRKLLHAPIRVYYRLQEAPPLIEILHLWQGSRKLPTL